MFSSWWWTACVLTPGTTLLITRQWVNPLWPGLHLFLFLQGQVNVKAGAAESNAFVAKRQNDTLQQHDATGCGVSVCHTQCVWGAD